MKLRNLVPDGFGLAVIACVIVASVLPARGHGATLFEWLTTGAIMLLFFLHGAKLSREAVMEGLGHWRLHLLVLASTFVLFPILGLAGQAVGGRLIDPSVAAGFVFMGLLPSTVQSSIAFTSVGKGNVAAAVCSASASNLIGIFLTPLLAKLLMAKYSGGGGFEDSIHSVEQICEELLLPFIAGHLSRPFTARWINARRKLVGMVDRSSILFIVYTAFSASVVEGLWKRLSAGDIAIVLVIDGAILAAALAITTAVSRALGFSRTDEVAIVFCGSKKSMASGIPMANILFAGQAISLIVLPLMLFHQIQLMTCAAIARRYAERRDDTATATVTSPATP